MPNPTSEKAEKSAGDIDLIRRLLADGKTVREIKTVTGFSLSTISKYAQIIEATGDRLCESVLETEGDKGTYQGVTDRPIKSEEDALAAFKIDRSVWKVKKMSVSAWTVGMKVKAGEKRPDKVIQTQQYRVKLDLERILPKALHEATEAIYNRIQKYAPKYQKAVKQAAKTGEKCLGVIALMDAHMGKLTWAPETGDNYDLKIAEMVYRNAVDDLIGESAGRSITKWVLPIGNDFYHIDSRANTTFAGTPQDVDGRYAKIIEAGEMAVIWAVERLMQSAPVEVIWVPGNHDPTTSFHLARTIQAWFRRCDRVKVDAGPSTRKYLLWNETLLGFTHGNEEKIATLPSIMATERPGEWAKSTCREWLLGHQHRSRQWQTQSVDTHEGTVVRVVKSLAGCDSWHHKRGYINPNDKAAEVYLYGQSRGYLGHSVVRARQAVARAG